MFRIYIIITLFLYNSLTVNAQICTGTLGENIFLEGDFGEGNANVLATNPNIAPGYNYTTTVPPLDGSYVITNDMGEWNNLFGTWLPAEDNSMNPDGYMMVVNASFEPGLFYEQTVTGLCENTLYEFSVDIINLIRSGTSNHIDPNVSFLLDGVEIFSTGDISKTNEWENFGFTFTTAPGQIELTLALQNNAPGGIGNDLGLDNITFRACGPETFVSPELDLVFLCEDGNSLELEATIIGNQYVNPVLQWQESFDGGSTWVDIPNEDQTNFTPETINSGLYFFRFLLADGESNLASEKCRVNSNVITLNIIPEIVTTMDTLCVGLTRPVGDSNYTETGIYMDTLLNMLGCDSIAITDLTFDDGSNFAAEIEASSPTCPDILDAQIIVNSVSGGFMPFSYTLEGVDLGSTSFFQDLAGGTSYSLQIENSIGCIIDTTVFIEDTPDLFLNLGADQTIELGESIDLNPQVNFTPTLFNWQSITPIDCVDFDECIPLDFTPLTTQEIILELGTPGGCSISDSIFIDVITVRKIFFANAFSPNGDGINDRFTVFGDSPNVQEIESLRIYDRWGAMLYEGLNFQANDLESGWDGTFRGKQMQTGIYTYSAVVRFIDDEVFVLSGEFYLME